jgi:hypothetical protein
MNKRNIDNISKVAISPDEIDISELLEACQRISFLKIGVMAMDMIVDQHVFLKDQFVLFRIYSRKDGYEKLPLYSIKNYCESVMIIKAHLINKDELYPEFEIQEIGRIPLSCIKYVLKVSTE